MDTNRIEPGLQPAGETGGGAPDDGANQAPPAGERRLPLGFVGTGSEFFRIWIVNLALTLLTLGIYSAWAKVRTLKYTYGNTRLDGSGFDYHGKPLAILKGRLLVLLLVIGLNLAAYLSPVLYAIAFIAFWLAWPWLLRNSLRFQMANTSYRALRFRFAGGLGEAYKVFMLWPVLAMLTFGLLAPYAYRRMRLYQLNETRFGTAPFSLEVGNRPFYKVFLMLFVLSLPAFAAFVAVIAAIAVDKTNAALLGFLPMVVMLLTLFLLRPYWQARVQNLVWNNVALAGHRFTSKIQVRTLFWLHLTNLLAIVFTLGLFYPFAKVRLLRYRLQGVALLAAGPLDTFVAGQADEVGATGSEAADWYDFDLSL